MRAKLKNLEEDLKIELWKIELKSTTITSSSFDAIFTSRETSNTGMWL
jgi:hypothetical protein